MELKKIQTLKIPITGDKIPIKWLFASYITLMIVVILRYAWICYDVSKNGAPKGAIEELSKTQRKNSMSLEILAGIFVLFSMAALGAPVAYAILSGIIVYLGVAGQDLAIAGETMVQRLFDGFLLLAFLFLL